MIQFIISKTCPTKTERMSIRCESTNPQCALTFDMELETFRFSSLPNGVHEVLQLRSVSCEGPNALQWRAVLVTVVYNYRFVHCFLPYWQSRLLTDIVIVEIQEYHWRLCKQGMNIQWDIVRKKLGDEAMDCS
jgi:hypothetical protein